MSGAGFLGAAGNGAERRGLEQALFRAWRDRGLPVRVAWGLADAGCADADDVRRLGRARIGAVPSIGPVGLARIGRAIGGWEPPVRRLHIYDPESGRIVESLALTAEQAAALDRLPGQGRHLRAIVVEGR